MSYHHAQNGGYGGGGRRGRYRSGDDRRGYDAPPPERQDTKLRNVVLKLADDPDSEPFHEILRLAGYLRDYLPANSSAIAEGIRIGLVEQPYKIPVYATLVAYLQTEFTRDPDSSPDELHPIIRSLLDDIVKGFQTYLDALKWLQLKLCVQFFAQLVSLRVIHSSSLLALLQSFISVLDEPGVSYVRSRSAALCAGEALLRSGSAMFKYDATSVTEMITSLRAFVDSQGPIQSLVSPTVRLDLPPAEWSLEPGETRETLNSLVKALTHLQSASFIPYPVCLPRPENHLPALESLNLGEGKGFDLPSFLVPPDPLDLDEDDLNSAPAPMIEDGKPKPATKSDVPSIYLTLFDDDVAPNDTFPAGYVVRTCVQEMLEIFEINRKEGARLLLELPRWFDSSTFKSRNVEDDNTAPAEEEVMGWNLECTIVETILSTAFLLPTSPHIAVYYYALITDLCKLSPATVGPAVGKSIRKLYRFLEDPSSQSSNALDVEVHRRFVEWFAVHMSNFSFNWVWKEWIPDLSLSPFHPKRHFIRRAIELEIRASYYDRIKESIPTAYHEADAEAVPLEAPGPRYQYEDAEHQYHAQAEALLELIRSRPKADEVVRRAQALCEEVASTHSLGLPEATSVVRSISVQVLLHVGARSFSHFLNAVERYLALLKFFSKDTDAKAEVLDAASAFWAGNFQMVTIVFDKLMQYQIVDPSDVVAWAFRDAQGVRAKGWDVLKAALGKASGRVAVARGKVQKVKKDEEDAKAKVKATKGEVLDEGMDVEEDIAESPTLVAALKAHSTLTRDQKTALVRAMDGFVSYLASAGSVLTPEAWYARESWGQQEWEQWETWGWFRQFCRGYSSQMRVYMNTLEAVSINKLDSMDGVDPLAASTLKRTWNIALGGE